MARQIELQVNVRELPRVQTYRNNTAMYIRIGELSIVLFPTDGVTITDIETALAHPETERAVSQHAAEYAAREGETA